MSLQTNDPTVGTGSRPGEVNVQYSYLMDHDEQRFITISRIVRGDRTTMFSEGGKHFNHYFGPWHVCSTCTCIAFGRTRTAILRTDAYSSKYFMDMV